LQRNPCCQGRGDGLPRGAGPSRHVLQAGRGSCSGVCSKAAAAQGGWHLQPTRCRGGKRAPPPTLQMLNSLQTPLVFRAKHLLDTLPSCLCRGCSTSGSIPPSGLARAGDQADGLGLYAHAGELHRLWAAGADGERR